MIIKQEYLNLLLRSYQLFQGDALPSSDIDVYYENSENIVVDKELVVDYIIYIFTNIILEHANFITHHWYECQNSLR
jgi:hypothetical protein